MASGENKGRMDSGAIESGVKRVAGRLEFSLQAVRGAPHKLKLELQQTCPPTLNPTP